MTLAALERRRIAIPVIAVTGVAWIAILSRSGDSGASSGFCCVPLMDAFPFSSEWFRLLLVRNPPTGMLANWALMLVAMMAPLLCTPVRHVLSRSFSQRRVRAVVLFIAGTFTVWMLAGLVLLSLVLAIQILFPGSILQIALVAVVAFVWQCSPAKQRCLNRGHAHPELAAFGTAADLDAHRFGLTHGFWCVGSCWALMLFSETIATGHLFAMAAVTIFILAEHIERPRRPSWRLRGVGKGVRATIAQTRQWAESNGFGLQNSKKPVRMSSAP